MAIPSRGDLILQSKVTHDVHQKGSHIVMARTFLSKPANHPFQVAGLLVRGGSDDEDEVESEESDNDDDDDEGEEKADGTALDLSLIHI